MSWCFAFAEGLPIVSIKICMLKQFIPIVQQRPVLYNHNLNDYHNKDQNSIIVDQEWEEMGVLQIQIIRTCKIM